MSRSTILIILGTFLGTILLLSVFGLGPTQAAANNEFYQDIDFGWFQPIADFFSWLTPDFKVSFQQAGWFEFMLLLVVAGCGYWGIMLLISQNWKHAGLLWLCVLITIVILFLDGLIRGTFL